MARCPTCHFSPAAGIGWRTECIPTRCSPQAFVGEAGVLVFHMYDPAAPPSSSLYGAPRPSRLLCSVTRQKPTASVSESAVRGSSQLGCRQQPCRVGCTELGAPAQAASGEALTALHCTALLLDAFLSCLRPKRCKLSCRESPALLYYMHAAGRRHSPAHRDALGGRGALLRFGHIEQPLRPLLSFPHITPC